MGYQFEKKKLHYANWNTVASPKSKGGLGLLKAEDKNLSLPFNLSWRLFSVPTTLWDSTLIQRYGSSRAHARSSFIWNNILIGGNLCTNRITWAPGMGHMINL